MSHEANGITKYAPHLRSFAAQIREYHALFTANRTSSATRMKTPEQKPEPSPALAVVPGSAVRRPASKHRDEWVRGYFCAVAILLRETCAEGAANTEAVSLFKNGGPWHDADAEDIEPFQRHGLIPPNK